MELLEFVVCMVQYHVFAQVVLKLADQSGCETWLVVEVLCIV